MIHGHDKEMVADRAGNNWFTANFKGYIGKLDP
jgi:streptogramin lyase